MGARRCRGRMRRIASDVRPGVLDRVGLAAGLERLH
jgi:signal transduction histidine kinase